MIKDLLDWYDLNAREMPWRIPPAASKAGTRPDPYQIWLSEVMLQQTTVAAVVKYFHAFTKRWPDVHALANAEDADVMAEWAGLGYYARARNLLKCARLVSGELGGVFPSSEAELLKLPGVGPYTAAAVAAIAYDLSATVVDANVERVMARIYAVQEPLPTSKEKLTELATGLTPEVRAGDYAQAVMDLGATICGRNPTCTICPWGSKCAAKTAGNAAELPRKLPKATKPVRHGVSYFVKRDDGAILLETRPDKGLLGGMLALPSTEWRETEVVANPPILADWREAGHIRHAFTHFHLILDVKTAQVSRKAAPQRGQFRAAAGFDIQSLPTVMRKAFRQGMSSLDLI